MMNTITSEAMIEKIQVMPLARENAAPEFRTNRSCSTGPRTGTVSPSVRLLTTRYLLNWSRPYAQSATPARSASVVELTLFFVPALRAKALEARSLLVAGGAHRRTEGLGLQRERSRLRADASRSRS